MTNSRVLLVDPVITVGLGLEVMLNRVKGFIMLGQVHTFADARHAVRTHAPSVVLIEPAIDDAWLSWVTKLQKLSPFSRFIALAAEPTCHEVETSLEVVDGFASKAVDAQVLVRCLHRIERGEQVVAVPRGEMRGRLIDLAAHSRRVRPPSNGRSEACRPAESLR